MLCVEPTSVAFLRQEMAIHLFVVLPAGDILEQSRALQQW